MRAMLFVNDSYFAYLLAEPVLREFHDEIALVVLSTRNVHSASRLRSIYSRTSRQYFLYRSTVQGLSTVLSKFRGRSVEAIARQYRIPVLVSSDLRASVPAITAFGPLDVGLAFNFDQKLDQSALDLCRYGVLNVHASKLPEDAGISPVLWAFARGDQTVWSTIYRMDSGVDTGPILEQHEIPVESGDSAFSLYQRVCAQSGRALADVLGRYIRGQVPLRLQSQNVTRTYWSWPDARHREMMRSSGRKFLRVKDIFQALVPAPRAQ